MEYENRTENPLGVLPVPVLPLGPFRIKHLRSLLSSCYQLVF